MKDNSQVYPQQQRKMIYQDYPQGQTKIINLKDNRLTSRTAD